MAWKVQHKPENSITEGVIWKTLLAFFFPILLGTFFQQMYNTADAIIVGKFVGKEALAAVGGATGSLINLIVGFFTGLASGATVVLSQFYGGRKNQEVSDTVHTAAALALAMGLFLTVAGIWLSPIMLEWLGTPEDVMGPSIIYLTIYFIGMIPSLVYNIGSGLLRAVGDSRRPLLFLIIACMTNIVLDVLLVVGFNMGVAGAAWATILSQLVSAVLIVLTLMRSHTSYRLQARKIRFHGDLMRRIVNIGFPAGMQTAMYGVANIIVQASVNSFGTDVIAAYTAFGKLDGFYWMVLGAFGISVTTFVGQNFGARRFDRVKKSVRVCLMQASVTTLVMCVGLMIFGRTLYQMFTDDPNVIEQGMVMLRILVPAYAAYICIEVFSGALRGVGDTLVATLFTLVGICVLRVAWVTLVVPRYHTLTMLMLCFPITWVLTSTLFIVYYLRSGWMQRAIRRAGM